MKNRRNLSLKLSVGSIVLTAAIAIAAVAAAVLFLSPRGSGEPEFSLPGPVTTQPLPAPTGVDDSNVTRDNVLAILAAMRRAGAYGCELNFTAYWDGGESAARIAVSADGSRLLAVQTSAGEVHTSLILGRELWSWDGGGENPSWRSLGSETAREVSELMRQATYEGVENLESFELLDAGFVDREGVPCIYMEYSHSADIECVTRVWIGVDYGLVVAEETRIMGKLAFLTAIDMATLDITTPPESEFELPDIFHLEEIEAPIGTSLSPSKTSRP